MSQIKVIRKLPDDVIKKIKAGEVIVRPVNAVKELLENSIDAGATSILVTVKGGGKDTIRIRDNGCGISKDDLTRAVERHTTSKLSTFEDLSDLKTLGFRGEALSSMAEVAYLTMISKTQNDICGYKIVVKEGKIIEGPKPLAFNTGTTVALEQLFYNMPLRRNSLKSSSEEYSAIIDVVTKYAIHHSLSASFAVEKVESKACDLQTDLSNSKLDNIKILYGKDVAQNLHTISISDPRNLFSLEGFISNLNFNYKKFAFILFINDRLVDCSVLKKSILLVYKIFMTKTCLPFVYLNIKMNPENLDVNVHPQKYEVRFRYEEYINSSIKNTIETYLSSPVPKASMSSKTSSTQVPPSPQASNPESSISKNQSSTFKSAPKVLPSKKIRSDHTSQTLDAVWGRGESQNSTQTSINSSFVEVRNPHIRKLREEVNNRKCPELRELIKNSCLVATIPENLLAVQYLTYLVVLDAARLSEELFYQLFLDNVANFPKITFDTQDVETLLRVHLENTDDLTPSKSIDEMIELITKSSIRETMNSYFSLEISPTGDLLSIPLLLHGYMPEFLKLPCFVYELANYVDWDDEEECFRSFGRCLAKFYSLSKRDSQNCKNLIINVLFPRMKAVLMPPYSLKDYFKMCVSTDQLYKVFERC